MVQKFKEYTIKFTKDYKSNKLPKYPLNSEIFSLGKIEEVYNIGTNEIPIFQYLINGQYYTQRVIDGVYYNNIINQNKSYEKLMNIFNREKSKPNREVLLLKYIYDYLKDNKDNWFIKSLKEKDRIKSISDYNSLKINYKQLLDDLGVPQTNINLLDYNEYTSYKIKWYIL